MYVIELFDSVDSRMTRTLCQDKNDLASLIADLDTDKYQIIGISGIHQIIDWKTFLKKEPGLELGGTK